MAKTKNVQRFVLYIIENNPTRVVSKQRIKEELMKSDLRPLDNESYSGDSKVSKLDRMLDQALYQLNKNKKIKSVRHGEWMPMKFKKRTPKPCQALIPVFHLLCRCGYNKTIRSERKPKNICPVCNKKLSVKEVGSYCPIRTTEIGKPSVQCALLYGTDFDEMKERVDPMKVCYFESKPVPRTVTYAKNKIQEWEERQRRMMLPKTRGF